MKTLRTSFRPAASPGSLADDLDRHPERADELREALGAAARRQRRRSDSLRRHRPEERDVGESGSRLPDRPQRARDLRLGAAVLRSA